MSDKAFLEARHRWNLVDQTVELDRIIGELGNLRAVISSNENFGTMNCPNIYTQGFVENWQAWGSNVDLALNSIETRWEEDVLKQWQVFPSQKDTARQRRPGLRQIGSLNFRKTRPSSILYIIHLPCCLYLSFKNAKYYGRKLKETLESLPR
jgi:hypothetical protein